MSNGNLDVKSKTNRWSKIYLHAYDLRDPIQHSKKYFKKNLRNRIVAYIFATERFH